MALYEGKLNNSEYLGNHLADIAAASLLQTLGVHRLHVEKWTGIAYLVAQRLSFIEVARWWKR